MKYVTFDTVIGQQTYYYSAMSGDKGLIGASSTIVMCNIGTLLLDPTQEPTLGATSLTFPTPANPIAQVLRVRLIFEM